MPPRMTFAEGEERMDSLSILRLARISWMIPQTMLQRKMRTKVNCVTGACASSSAIAAIRQSRLKKVQMFPTKMLLYV